LKARTILFQCPASFKQTKENISNLEEFFSNINRGQDREQLNFCWEPRGDWDSRVIKRVCETLNLWHAVDPFTAQSVTPAHLYFRLHGSNGWRYEYEEGELRELVARLPAGVAKSELSPRAGSRLAVAEAPYVFFNNARMTPDALRFQTMIQET